MVDLTHYGKVKEDIAPLIKAVQAFPTEAWEFRGDKESYETSAVRPGTKYWIQVKDLIEKVLNSCELYLKPGYQTRVVLSCIPAGKQILPHTDDFGEEVRKISIHCHIPLITHESIKMGFGEIGHEKEYHLKAGHLYTMDETIRHYVNNPSHINRVHLLFAWHKHVPD